MKKKKEHAGFLHIIFALLVVIGVTIMYTNIHYGEGISWIANETYEDSANFTKQFRTDTDNIFNYVKYKEVFETNGILDYSKPIVSVSEGPAGSKTYTVDEMVRTAKSMGYYLDRNFKVSGGQPGDDEDQNLRIDWRAYDPDLQYKEPGDAFCTLDALSQEVLSHLGNYYAFYYKFIQNPSNLKFQVSYTNTDTDYRVYTNTNKSIDELKNTGRYIYLTGTSPYIDANLSGNLSKTLQSISSPLEKNNPYDNSNYYMIVAVDTAYPHQDSYSQASQTYEYMRLLFILGLVCLIIGILGCAASLYYMVCLTGHPKKGNDAIVLSKIDQISGESCILLSLIAAVCALFISEHLINKILHLFLSEGRWFYGELVLRVLILYIIGIVAALSLIRRYKAGVLWSGSVTKQVLNNIALYFKNHRFTTRLMVTYVLFVGFNISIILACSFLFFAYDNIPSLVLIGILAVLFAGIDFWVFHQMYKNAWEMDQINEAVVKISEGDTTYKIKADDFWGKEEELAKNINNISSGLETALQEKVQSERLKADLITNVSHDIKTPLTSIINYVDLIKREHIQDPKVQGYLEVLEQKSQRLKTLTEDLVEASKASSGNLKLEVSDIDFVELVQQSNGEFEEKFAIRHLEVISNLPDEAILIRVDGRHMWRVLENLYNNAFKYAMEHSRIYIDIIKSHDKVIFTIKNISDTPLNIHADDLTERFVRGDVARTTEGSGLGLSIAKSLTELQGGEFAIYIDGDLFKVQISFMIP